MSGDYSPGALNVAADIIGLAASETETWIDAHEASHIPDALSEAADTLRKDAKEIAERNP